MHIILMNSYSNNDSLNIKRLTVISCSELLSYSAGMIYLNNIWYKNYPRTKFHFFDDSSEWLQMDKVGHSFSAYLLAKNLKNGLIYSGVNNNKASIIGSSLSFIAISSIDIFDGFSSEWGASLSDLTANFIGSSLFSIQNIIWKDERIIPKFSYHTTKYSDLRPSVLGKNFGESLIKDYNGQTYWLSFNINSFLKQDKFPNWLCFSLGYGANGMIGARNNFIDNQYYNFERKRQYYLSLDLDLSKIETKSKVFNSILKMINFVKIPFPAIEYSKNKVDFYGIYF